MTSLLTGVVVGVAHMIFISAISYESYVEGMLRRIDEMRSIMVATGGGSYNNLFEQMVSGLRSAEQPTILTYVITSANNYILCGGVIGFIIASFVRREPKTRVEE
jgi:spore coat polysaccharide biosynthesis predicted glycosyltransferase SpsG